jgi:putative phosphoribosyl transferase
MSGDPGPRRAAHTDAIVVERTHAIELETVRLVGDVVAPVDARGIVIFAHGSGSSRRSPRNRAVARALNEAGLATLLLDLLTIEEEGDRRNVFDLTLLGTRLTETTAWVRVRPELAALSIGYFGASTGAGAALAAAADLGHGIGAVVSRGGRPDLARTRLAEVVSPTLLIVGGCDPIVLQLNREAGTMLRCEKRLEVVPGATHLFQEPGALERVASLAVSWFTRHLDGAGGLIRSRSRSAPRTTAGRPRWG